MAFGDHTEVRASAHERAEDRLGIFWIQICRVVEYIVEDFDWAVLDRHRVCSKSIVQVQRLYKLRDNEAVGICRQGNHGLIGYWLTLAMALSLDPPRTRSNPN